ncbi:hypothetical protein GCM10010967_08270 [Dyadobacter beijingensis]|uniref:Uncharacterized protein n=1 Tax=Dyadobacter beijingensis TaxID=365489 RepID=A0ABQ2HFE8_9BACT|nr:hypothetical protein [Dyadobacter beijingensis]GGM78899.1 hypothetical protein GCM10010967_08270 [Dyadobacter beijingensis]
MKILYTFLILFFFGALSAHAQTVNNAEHDAYFADFYVMQVKPMQFELSYKYPKTDRVLVRIRDEEQNVIFVEKTLVYKRYHKNFDLTIMRDGKYTFELTDGEEKFVQSFVVATKTQRVATAL